MLLNIRLLVYRKRFHKLSQKAGNFGAGGLKNLRAGRLWGGFTCICLQLGIQSFHLHTVVSSRLFWCDKLTGVRWGRGVVVGLAVND